MRTLTASELVLVSGGTSSSDDGGWFNFLDAFWANLMDALGYGENDEIVVNGHRPEPVNFGGGWSVAFYDDGISQVFHDDVLVDGSAQVHVDGTTTWTNEANLSIPPSIKDTITTTAHFTWEHVNQP